MRLKEFFKLTENAYYHNDNTLPIMVYDGEKYIKVTDVFIDSEFGLVIEASLKAEWEDELSE